MASAPPSYPIAVEIDPAAPQNRLTVFFRYFMAIPHAIIIQFLSIAAQIVTLIAWFAILFTGRYPAGMYNFSAGVLRWTVRVNAYSFLLAGAYPPFALDEAAYPIRVSISPETEGRNRLTTFFRLILVIPHAIVLGLISIAAFVVLFIAWIAALIVGSVPAGLHNFIAGFTRWQARVNAYALLLTDRYPPFSLE